MLLCYMEKKQNRREDDLICCGSSKSYACFRMHWPFLLDPSDDRTLRLKVSDSGREEVPEH